MSIISFNFEELLKSELIPNKPKRETILLEISKTITAPSFWINISMYNQAKYSAKQTLRLLANISNLRHRL